MKRRPWLRALAWLVFLGPFFFLTYNFANAVAAHRAHVGVEMFPWERHIPFLAWTILPYWSSDLLYALSLAVCRTRAELDLHARRLVAVQLLAVAFFLAFPLRASWVRPPVSGWEGALFGALRGFDRPFNQAPSLHAALAVILWARYRAHTDGLLRVALGAWLALVALSTLTTYQHHFIDLPTGLWAGLLTVAALPERRAAAPQVRLTLAYVAGAALCTAGAFALGGFGWLLLWPAFALSMVAAAYWTGDAAWLGEGRGPLQWVMLPYAAGAWINSRLWTWGEAPNNHVAEGVWIGRAPSRAERSRMNSVVDLAPELRIRADAHLAMMDLVPPAADQLAAAVGAITALAGRRPTLVCCALGYKRSAAAAAAWLLAAGHAANPKDALDRVRRARPQVAAAPELVRCLEQWAEGRDGDKG